MDAKNDMDLETAFNLLVQLARSNKLTWEDHQRVTVAIEKVMKALNKTEVTEVTRVNEDDKDKK
jgi:hypothetical protein